MKMRAWLIVSLAVVMVSDTEELNLRRRRVVNGNNAFQAQFPYMSSLQNKVDGLWFCSAIIIDIRWILTAGHCVKSDISGTKEDFEVVVGTFRKYSGEKYRVSQTFVHPDYKLTKPHIYNDVALIRLAEPLTLSETIQPIPLGLPPKNEEEVIGAGWGRIDPDYRFGSPFLQSIVLKVMETQKCQEIHVSANNIINGTTQICVYSEVKGSFCFGDSGGPLVSMATGRLVGVFSSLEDCAGKYPPLFSKIWTFVGWIESVTGRKFPLK